MSKLYLVRLLCHPAPLEPAEFYFDYVYADSEEEAKRIAVERSGMICIHADANEISEGFKEELERRRKELDMY